MRAQRKKKIKVVNKNSQKITKKIDVWCVGTKNDKIIQKTRRFLLNDEKWAGRYKIMKKI